MSYKIIYLKKGKESSLLRFHPWVFSGAIAKQDDNINEGELVEVYDASKQYLAIGHYQKESIDKTFWKKRLETAYNARKALGLDYTEKHNTFRLVHGEGDFLPGLIVDLYGSTAVLQAHSVGMHLVRQELG